jgi:hypothetical protein
LLRWIFYLLISFGDCTLNSRWTPILYLCVNLLEYVRSGLLVIHSNFTIFLLNGTSLGVRVRRLSIRLSLRCFIISLTFLFIWVLTIITFARLSAIKWAIIYTATSILLL